MDLTETTRTCNKCGIEQPIEKFYRIPQSGRRRRSCSSCLQRMIDKKRLERFEGNKEAVREQMRVASKNQTKRYFYRWLAGILDFSGSLRIRGNQPELRVFGAKDHLQIIRDFADCGTVTPHGSSYVWSVYRKEDILQILDLILPSLKLQKDHFAEIRKQLKKD